MNTADTRDPRKPADMLAWLKEKNSASEKQSKENKSLVSPLDERMPETLRDPSQFVAQHAPPANIISHERPTCPHCGCAWTIETYGPEASSRCWSCRNVIEDTITHKHAPNDATGVDRPRRLLPWGA